MNLPFSVWFIALPATLGFGALFVLLQSYLSGWRRLALVYRTTVLPTERRERSVTGLMQMVSYFQMLDLSAGTAGLVVAVDWPFRIAHPRLLIPWEEIKVTPRPAPLWKAVRLRFTRVPGTCLEIRASVASRLGIVIPT